MRFFGVGAASLMIAAFQIEFRGEIYNLSTIAPFEQSTDEATRKVVHEEVTGGSTKTVTATGNDLKTNANCLEVENNKGATLPGTGGIGTTIFYIMQFMLRIIHGHLSCWISN